MMIIIGRGKRQCLLDCVIKGVVSMNMFATVCGDSYSVSSRSFTQLSNTQVDYISIDGGDLTWSRAMSFRLCYRGDKDN
jgi:hypothetical protein